MEDRFIEHDSIQPTQIEHKCEEIYFGDKLEQKYNYLVYHFEIDGAYFWARAYLDEIETVSLHGPFESREIVAPIAGQLDSGMIAYFRRRYERLQTFSDNRFVDI